MCIWWEIEGWEGDISDDTRFQSNCHTLRTKLKHVIVVTNGFFSGLAQLTYLWWPGCSRSVTIGYNEDRLPGDIVTLRSQELLLCALLYHQVHHTLIKDKIKDLCSPVSSSWSKTHQRQNQWQRGQCSDLHIATWSSTFQEDSRRARLRSRHSRRQKPLLRLLLNYFDRAKKDPPSRETCPWPEVVSLSLMKSLIASFVAFPVE